MRAANMALAFLLELMLVVAVARFGYGLGGAGIAGWVLAALAAFATMALWGYFAAPKSGHRLTGAGLLAFKALMFAAGSVALAASHGPASSAAFAAASALHLVIALRLGAL